MDLFKYKNSECAKLHELESNWRITPIPFAAEDSRRYDLAKMSLAEIKIAIEHLSFAERAELANGKMGSCLNICISDGHPPCRLISN